MRTSLQEQNSASRRTPKREVSIFSGLRRFLAPSLLFSVILFQLWVRLTHLEHGYRLEELRSVSLKNDAQLREKRLEYAYYTRPDLLRELARQRLALEPLQPQRIRSLSLRGLGQ
jgi:hypothetical protein